MVPLTASSLAPGDSAGAVWGQPDFFHNWVNFLQGSGLDSPSAVAIDSTSLPPPHVLVYVADKANSRVLGFVDPTSLLNAPPASIVIGQPDFNSSGCNDGTTQGDANGLGPDSLCHPTAVTVDSVGNLYVADTGNNRVLEYNSPFAALVTKGLSASAVFGQVSPSGGFNKANCADGREGDPPPTAFGLCKPSGVGVDSAGNLYVADTGNNRVLEYNTPLNPTSTPGSGDDAADLVFGQSTPTDFAGNSCNGNLPAPSAATLCAPASIGVDSGNNLYVADTGNNRVLEYNTPLTVTIASGSGDTIADLVFGQSTSSDFADNFCNGSSARPSASTLCGPRGIAFDSANDLYVADTGNNRVLEYNTPLAVTTASGRGDTIADLVFGQSSSSDFADSLCNGGSAAPSAISLCAPSGVALDLGNNLYLADTGNNRVLEYNTPLAVTSAPASGDTAADAVLGQIDFVHKTVDNVDARGLHLPGAVAVDTSSSKNHLYIADTANSRVLGWKDATAAKGSAPDLVLGQPDLNSNACNSSAAPPPKDLGGLGPDSLCHPTALALDSDGNLYVADTGNNRVLEYSAPIAGCVIFPCIGPPAHEVFGQNDLFTVNTCGLGPGLLCSPAGVAVDAAGNVFIADSGNNRVLEYNSPLAPTATPGSGDTSADLVFGQTNFTASLCSNGASASISAASSPDPTPSASATAIPTPTPTGNPGPSAAGLCGPSSLALDAAGNLYVADTLNNRALEYDTPLAKPAAPNRTADRVFGQASSTDFADAFCNGSSATPSASTLCAPMGVGLDVAGHLYVSDSANSRVLVYNTPLKSQHGSVADNVLGQRGLFSSNQCNLAQAPGELGVIGSDTLCLPSGLAFDRVGNLYVADTANNRALEYIQIAPSAPTLSVSSATLDFGNAVVSGARHSTVPASLKLSNPKIRKGNLPVRVEGISLLTAGDFAIKRGCASMLRPGSKCEVALTFAPITTGRRQGRLKIVSNAANSPEVVNLIGTGVEGTLVVTLSTTGLSFRSQKVGTRSLSKSVTLTNKSAVTVGIAGVAISGANPSDFVLRNHCPSSLAKNKSCSVGVAFKPTFPSARIATLTFTDDAGQQQVGLIGVGR